VVATTRRTAHGSGTWWDNRALLQWTAVNGAAYLVVVGAGVALETLFADAARSLAGVSRSGAVLVVALLGSSWHAFVLGRWQWRILRRRLPDLDRRRWVLATFVPAFLVWLLVFAPEAVDALTAGGVTLAIYRDAFVQALVLGPLIGLGQAFALRRDTARWAWWFLANVTTYLFGAALFEAGRLLLDALSVEQDFSTAFPLLTFAFHGAWMLWVSDPAVAAPSSHGR
jgi:hypothetical protein